MTAKILLDARKLGDGGIGTYIENLVDGILELGLSPSEVALSLLVNPTYRAIQTGEKSCFSRWDGAVRLIEDRSRPYSFREYFLLSFAERQALEQASLYHSPHFTLPYFTGLPTVVTIHDCIHLSYPRAAYHRPIARVLIGSALRRASHIITVSAASAVSLKHHFDVNERRLTMIPNALHRDIVRSPMSETRSRLQRFGFQSPYLLFVGSDRSHKGLHELLPAWQMFLGERRLLGIEPQLVLVGRDYGTRTLERIVELGLHQSVKLVGEVSTEMLSVLYTGASGVILPSREEGFGLVALEAFGCGTSVLATPLASIHEVCGEAAWYSDGFDRISLARLIEAFWFADAPVRERKVELGMKFARRYSRTAVARTTLQVYDRVLSRKSPEYIIPDESPMSRVGHSAVNE